MKIEVTHRGYLVFVDSFKMGEIQRSFADYVFDPAPGSQLAAACLRAIADEIDKLNATIERTNNDNK